MNTKLEVLINILIGCACLVIITLGLVELKRRVITTTPIATNTVEATAGNQSISLSHASTITTGNPKLVLIEFSDYQCPFCARYAQDTFADLRAQFVDRGVLKYAVMNFPLQEIHPFAFNAAAAAICAGEQGKYWEMHEQLFSHQRNLANNDLAAYANALGLDAPRFSTCVGADTTTAIIKGQMAEGRRVGINGTPTFVLGTVNDNGTIRVVRKVSGAASLAVFASTIDALLTPLNNAKDSR